MTPLHPSRDGCELQTFLNLGYSWKSTPLCSCCFLMKEGMGRGVCGLLLTFSSLSFRNISVSHEIFMGNLFLKHLCFLAVGGNDRAMLSQLFSSLLNAMLGLERKKGPLKINKKLAQFL